MHPTAPESLRAYLSPVSYCCKVITVMLDKPSAEVIICEKTADNSVMHDLRITYALCPMPDNLG